MKYLTVAFTFALVFGLGRSAWADDTKFMRKAASGGMLEVKLGHLATQQADSPDVRKFGERMVADHSKTNKELMAIAEKKGIMIPMEKIEDKHQAIYDKLKVLKGADFDRAYMKHMVKDHEEDVAEFSKFSKEAKDEQVKNFASNTLPTLKEHLQKARDVAAKVGAVSK